MATWSKWPTATIRHGQLTGLLSTLDAPEVVVEPTRLDDWLGDGFFPHLVEVDGESVTYAGSSIDALIDRQPVMIEEWDGRRVATYMAKLTLLRDATDGVASPAYEDEVTFDDRTWYVIGIEGGSSEELVDVTVRHVDERLHRQSIRARRS
jgi:hypothetical protein